MKVCGDVALLSVRLAECLRFHSEVDGVQATQKALHHGATVVSKRICPRVLWLSVDEQSDSELQSKHRIPGKPTKGGSACTLQDAVEDTLWCKQISFRIDLRALLASPFYVHVCALLNAGLDLRSSRQDDPQKSALLFVLVLITRV